VFYVDTDIVDYLNDTRVLNKQVTGYFDGNQGAWNNSGDSPFSYFNYLVGTQVANDKELSVRNRREEYFAKFITLLSNNFKRERTVGFYAEQMCVTPKYLSLLIKEFSGKSAAEWIDYYVITEAKTLLRYSTMSIQEVAYELSFSSQSFFGKYFKRRVGMSPKEYRRVG
jgi:AraC-like DNA-binding protein